MKELTEETKLLIYEEALKLHLELGPRSFFGFCNLLARVQFQYALTEGRGKLLWDCYENDCEDFPEIYKHKPLKKYQDTSYWFAIHYHDDYQHGFDIRTQILEEAIATVKNNLTLGGTNVPTI